MPNPSSTIAGVLSPEDRLLAEKGEEAVRDGLQLERWWRQKTDLPYFPLRLGKTFRLPNRAEGFFSTTEINGEQRTVMGCRQLVEFGPIDIPDATERLRQFVLGEFLPRAHWTYPDGFPGGFTVEQSLYKTAAGECGRFPAEQQQPCIDWRQLGKEFAWVLFTVQIHDFVMDFGPFRKRLREAACVTAHPDFIHVAENPTEEYAFEVSIGYPFVEVSPVPNFFGFGPGKFGTAVKLFSFFITRQKELRVRMVFAAAPRCRKVFDFGKGIPDPVYGGASMFRYMTLGLWNPQRFHDSLDAKMLEQHCRVHQALMDGVEEVWKEWVKNPDRKEIT